MLAHRRDFLTLLGMGCAFGPVKHSAAAAPPRDLPLDVPSPADLGSQFDAIEQLVPTGEFSDSFLQPEFTSVDKHRDHARAIVLNSLACHPSSIEFRPELIDRADMGDYVREKIVFSTSPAFRVPAYVLIPKRLRERAPAIVDLHSHGGMFLYGKEKVIDLGENSPTMVEYHRRNYDGRPTATELVRRGYVVITIDALMFGERRVIQQRDAERGFERSRYSAEDVQVLNQQCRQREATVVKGLTLAGLTWPGIVTADDLRTVDYLVTRPEVDLQRIGCVGVSFGGHRSLFLGGLDDRIKAACVTGFMSTVRPMIRQHLDTHSFVHFVPQLHHRLDLPDVVGLRAPLPLLVQQCSQDGLFPLAGMQAAVEKLTAIYDKAGARTQFIGRFYDVPHRFSREMQEDAFAFFDRHLKS
jgi:dienelactone hydrolase